MCGYKNSHFVDIARAARNCVVFFHTAAEGRFILWTLSLNNTVGSMIPVQVSLNTTTDCQNVDDLWQSHHESKP